MGTLAIQRLVGSFIVLFLVSILVFIMVATIPGDPVEIMTGVHVPPEIVSQLRTKYGLDKPVIIRYFLWLKATATGDLGVTVAGRIPVGSLIRKAFPISFELTVLSLLVAGVIAVPLGTFAAVRVHSRFDKTVMFVGLSLASFPGYVTGLVLLLLFSLKLRMLPAGGYVAPTKDLLGNLRYMVMPAFSMGLFLAGGLMRYIRSGMLDVLGKDYITVSRAKGLAEYSVIFKHAARNALVPVITFLGLQLGGVLGGAIITETIFLLPGLGSLGLRAVLSREFTLVQGVILVIAVWYITINVLVDLLAIYVNPRIRYQ